MSQEIKALNEHDAAGHSLVAAASKTNESLGPFSSWLIAGVGAAFSLLIANVDKISQFVCLYHIRIALLMLLIGLIVSIFARLLSAMVSAALGSREAGLGLAKQIQESGRPFDVKIFITEYERGLFPYQRWLARKSMDKAIAGDSVAVARMIAKLSQTQAILVLTETLLVAVAAGVLVVGLRTQ
ncbi:MAG: hypothetical protein A3I66_15820 [Burkholderiales bacterium RIFCSPLOWO2_02_FULL_57_36]|nr:MAG: hypothetical protein A3I66_15820 [Burkholderiales bacterium RIFCSPLOWO2_02_FULL_57_36]